MSDIIRCGTIGTSRITDEFIESTKLADGIKVSAVYSRSRQKGTDFASKYGIHTVFTDLNEMALSNQIDAVYIASPNSLHYGQSKLFLEHGKHVLCEKPVTVTPEELEELTELAKKNNLIYMEAIKMLHLPVRHKLKEALNSIGKITMARFDYCQLSSKYPAYLKGEVPNIFNPEFATGCLMDLGIYCVYPAIDFFGYPDKITAVAGFLNTGADGYGNSFFTYPDKQVHLSYSKVGQGYIGSEIIGDKGTIVIGSISTLTNIKIHFNDGTKKEIIGDVSRYEVMKEEIQNFCNFIKDKNHYKEDYLYAGKLALQVSKAIKTIRQQAGIRFPNY